LELSSNADMVWLVVMAASHLVVVDHHYYLAGLATEHHSGSAVGQWLAVVVFGVANFKLAAMAGARFGAHSVVGMGMVEAPSACGN
jgi:hypothetical protein